MIARQFRQSPPSVGLELEWQIIDRTTMDLSESVLSLIDLLPGDPSVKPEVIQTSVEAITPPAVSTAALRSGLMDTMQRLLDAAERLELMLVGAGTHPFCKRLVPITPLPRYAEMEQCYGYLAHTQSTYSLQVHVGMPSGDVALRVMAWVRGLLPALLGISASSPFYHGEKTAFASYRTRIVAATRSYGIPPSFEDIEAFLRFIDTVERAQIFSSYRDMHWDIRPRPDLGTLEVRIMDAQPTVNDSLALGALVHSLLVTLIEMKELDPRLPVGLPWWVEKENSFRASHEGLEAAFVFDASGRTKSLRELGEDIFALCADKAEELGETEDLARARAIFEEGSSGSRQLEVYERTGSTRAVTGTLANALRTEMGREAVGRGDWEEAA